MAAMHRSDRRADTDRYLIVLLQLFAVLFIVIVVLSCFISL